MATKPWRIEAFVRRQDTEGRWVHLEGFEAVPKGYAHGAWAMAACQPNRRWPLRMINSRGEIVGELDYIWTASS